MKHFLFFTTLFYQTENCKLRINEDRSKDGTSRGLVGGVEGQAGGDPQLEAGPPPRAGWSGPALAALHPCATSTQPGPLHGQQHVMEQPSLSVLPHPKMFASKVSESSTLVELKHF